MSWTDKTALETIKKLRDDFKINTFIETGTFKGINAFVQSSNFKYVITCEKNEGYFLEAKEKLRDKKNVIVLHEESPRFLKDFVTAQKKNKKRELVIIYLDAHFYNPADVNRFVVVNELGAMKSFKDCIIIIHDFDNGMGHITYDGIPLDSKIVGEPLKTVNKHFNFYVNSEADIHTKNSLKEIGLENDEEAIDNIEYAWSHPRLTKRGILYAIPKRLKLKDYKLTKWNI